MLPFNNTVLKHLKQKRVRNEMIIEMHMQSMYLQRLIYLDTDMKLKISQYREMSHGIWITDLKHFILNIC